MGLDQRRKMKHVVREFSAHSSIRGNVPKIKVRKTHLQDFKINEVHFDHERHQRIGNLRLRV